MCKVFSEVPEILESLNWSEFGLPNRSGSDSTFWLGSQGSSTPCHQDTYGCNLVAQLIGKKCWTLFPPEQSSSLYPTRIPFEESSIFSQVSLEKIDLAKFPKMKLTKPYFIVLEPGDVLFVPHHWWHYVSCLDTALSINTWIPLSADKESQLREAVTRTLATLLIPCYENEDETWLNADEKLTSTDENLTFLKKLLLPQTTGDADGEKPLFESSHEATPVMQYSLETYAAKSGSQLIGSPSGSPHRKRSKFTASSGTLLTRDIVKSFLHPDVADLIVEKLKIAQNS